MSVKCWTDDESNAVTFPGGTLPSIAAEKFAEMVFVGRDFATIYVNTRDSDMMLRRFVVAVKEEVRYTFESELVPS